MSPPSVQKDKPNKTFVVNPILVGKPLVYTYSIPAFKQILASGAPFGKPFTSKQYLKYVMSKLKIKRPHPVLRRVLLLPVFWEKMLSLLTVSHSSRSESYDRPQYSLGDVWKRHRRIIAPAWISLFGCCGIRVLFGLLGFYDFDMTIQGHRTREDLGLPVNSASKVRNSTAGPTCRSGENPSGTIQARIFPRASITVQGL